jgi:DNA ligase-1
MVVMTPEITPMLPQYVSTLQDISMPVFVTPKLEGLRCIISQGRLIGVEHAISNERILELCRDLPELDGELVVGRERGGNVWARTVAGALRTEGDPEFTLWASDTIEEAYRHMPYRQRYGRVKTLVEQAGKPYLKLAPLQVCTEAQQVIMLERVAIEQGLDGVILRDPDAPYIYGSQDLDDPAMAVLKRYRMDYGVIVDIIEEMRTQAGGRLPPPHVKLQPAGRARGLVVAHRVLGVFMLTEGIDHGQRARLWIDREKLYGRRVCFRIHLSDKTRDPIFAGIED